MFSEPPDVKPYGSRVSPESGYDTGSLWTEHSVYEPSAESLVRSFRTPRRNRRLKSLHKYPLAGKEHAKVLSLKTRDNVSRFGLAVRLVSRGS